ncbi:TetR/AcrR family transcriptional regulator [Microbacterium aurantiacum]|uniref:TetR/AcrR family transcriptional regulator n=1 Tax=Microbacterium aurantiacum TaxID=162393 RepID=UPI000C809E72|nr:TetR/AcrR family transcriptional regulator [Microbacterium aurantiacum]
MPRSSEQNEALRSATRSAIETAAVQVFARRGFAAASIRQIADQAGISTGSIYRHYSGKEELFEELLAQASHGIEGAATRLSEEGDPKGMILAFTEAYLVALAADDGAAEFSTVMEHGITTDTPLGTAERLAPMQQTLWRAFSALVRRGQSEGQFVDGDPDQLTACYFAMISGLTTMRITMRDRFSEPDTAMILRILTGETR